MSIIAPRPRVVVALTLAVLAILVAGATPAHAAYDPLDIISYDTWRASGSMSDAEIQSFLDAQPGVLKSLVTTDYAGRRKSAAVIIGEAARAWNLNPKVIIATLDKEQSLICQAVHTKASDGRHGTYDYHLPKAMGCGVYAGSPNTYPGFGNQVWNGARKLSTYEVTYGWYAGKPKRVFSYPDNHYIDIVPKNACTFALYTYTPYYPQRSFWDLYVRYFGDPRTPSRMRPVYRFLDRVNGSYFYTASEGERYRTLSRLSSRFRYAGVAFAVDTSATGNSTPLHRLYHPKTRKWAYTTSSRTRTVLISRGWSPRSTVASVALGSSAGAPVFVLQHKVTGGQFYTSSDATRILLTKGSRALYIYRGVGFRLAASAESTPPVGP